MLLLLTLLACGPQPGDSADTADSSVACAAPYQPFDAANYDNQLLRVQAYEQIVALRKSEDFSAASFDEIEDLYLNTASLAEKVQGRQDPHDYARELAVGQVMHDDIMAAIDSGKAGEQIAVQGQIVDKTLQRFFGLSVYYEGLKAADDSKSLEDVQAGWDEGFGYFGISNDGSETTGIATTLAKRDAEFGSSLVDGGFNALLDGRCALAVDDRAAALEAINDVDLYVQQGFALAVVHEMDEYEEDRLIKGWEGLLYWRAVAELAFSLDEDKAAAVDAAFAGDVEDLDAPALRAQVIDIFGLGI